jgi:hypothetical protein
LRTIGNFRVVRNFRTFRSTCANTCGMYQMTHLCDDSAFHTRMCETDVLVHVHMQVLAAEWSRWVIFARFDLMCCAL